MSVLRVALIEGLKKAICTQLEQYIFIEAWFYLAINQHTALRINVN